MKTSYVIAGAVLFVAVLVGSSVPLWTATADISLTGFGWGALVVAVIFTSVVAGGLMFLVFYSARQGYDEGGQMHKQERHSPGRPSEKI